MVKQNNYDIFGLLINYYYLKKSNFILIIKF